MLQQTALNTLKALLPRNQVFTDRASLLSYEVDAGLDKGIPEAVVFPRTVEEVERIVRWAAQHRVPLVARGAGTGLSGGAVADRGGVIVEFSHMDQVLNIDAYGRSAIVEPATINLRLDAQVRKHSMYFPPDPASQRASTIGGNVAENSGGPHCFKYGVTTNYVTGLQAVLANGQRIRVGGRAFDYPEYDLCGLITGSEGTLALMTEIFLRLIPNPPAVRTMLAVFDTVEQASNAVSAVIAAGLVPATLELMEQKIIRIAEPYAHAGLPLDAGAILVIDIDGNPESLDVQSDEIAQIMQRHGVREVRISNNEDERYKIWLARKSVAGAITRLTPSYYTVDITVPRSRLAEALGAVDQICERNGLRVGHLSHAGDGNLHPMVMISDIHDKGLMERVHRGGWEIVKYCVEMGGSLTGEHGVGIEKREYMSLMHTPAELMAMWDIKETFDPNGLLNPGKIFPSSKDAGVPFAGYTRQFTPLDDIGAAPGGTVFTPATAEEAARGLLALAHEGKSVQIVGAPVSEGVAAGVAAPSGERDAKQLSAQTDMASPVRPPRASMYLSTSKLSGIHTYAPDDLCITVGAGTTLAEMQEFLAKDRKQVPLVSPWPSSTIGGLIAANINAPLRMRYGAMRDLVLCGKVALTDGRLIRVGRAIVKNVAGYDLPKVFIGSHGTLGLFTEVTLKLTVQPRARRTLLVPVHALEAGARWASEALPHALVASAVVLCTAPQGSTSHDNTQHGSREGLPLSPAWDEGRQGARAEQRHEHGSTPHGSTQHGSIQHGSREGLPLSPDPHEGRLSGDTDDWDGRGVSISGSHVPVGASSVADSPYLLAYTAEGIAEDVQAELARVRAALRAAGAGEIVEVEEPTGSDLWAFLLGQTGQDDLLLRAGVPVKDLPSYLRDHANALDGTRFIADFASGLLYVIAPTNDVEQLTAKVARLRSAALAQEGYAVVMHLPSMLEGKIDTWGYQPQGLELMKRLKARWDPKGMLNPGAFVLA